MAEATNNDTQANGAKTGPRERYRAQVRAEIKECAWRQMAEAGASALSFNAVAKQMGMTGPALYRYFASRDDLITELVKDAYRSLADTMRASVDAGPDPAALGHAMRAWALADPQRYFLAFGTPVPGYHAPGEITRIADEVMASMLAAFAALPAGGLPARGPATPFETHLEGHREWADGHASPATLRRVLAFWTRLHGAVSLELAGHFTGMGFDPARLFAAELDDLLAGVGVRAEEAAPATRP
ncbi:TetR/AcrR family transcriptional regulator [Streptomyces sp. NPDC057654]|uniref:TetR/AcrR family transcriptional regulator n=1 Tax=Streptomyces sp. NPDC057654 TaxID=3346196 RepID=UPI0036C9EDA6